MPKQFIFWWMSFSIGRIEFSPGFVCGRENFHRVMTSIFLGAKKNMIFTGMGRNVVAFHRGPQF